MIGRVVALFFMLIVALVQTLPLSAAELLGPDEAFRLQAELQDKRALRLQWTIANHYKLYREYVRVSVTEGKAELQPLTLPKGIMTTDPVSGEKIEIYHDQLTVSLPMLNADAPFTLNVSYQGCAEDGLCFPPITKRFRVNPEQVGKLTPLADASLDGGANPFAAMQQEATSESATSAKASTPQPKNQPENDFSLATSALASGSLWQIVPLFFLFGLLLSFTPCILPMVPIISSIIVGEGNSSRSRSFLLAVAYCLGMALVYTSLGVAAGLAGEGFAGFLQKPWVLILFSLLLFVFALSMFDLYQLQIPTALQNRLCKASGNLKRGRFVGVFFMGALSALLVGPCVAGPLAGTLLYISQSRDVLLGGFALFAMATGMSVPLLLVGVSAGSLLPKAGTWMVGVKYLFGVLLIGVAIWMVTPVLPMALQMVLWAALMLLSALFLGLLDAAPEKATVGMRFKKTAALLLLCGALVEVVGAASGGSNPLQPLAHLRPSAGSSDAPANNQLHFTTVRSLAELETILQSTNKPVMLDFYADWCVSCKEMDAFVFEKPEVQQALSSMQLLRVDVTANNADDRALLKRFNLFGPPGIIFFNAEGKEIAGSHIVGALDAEAFLQHLQTLP